MLDQMEPEEVMDWRAYFELRDKGAEETPKPKAPKKHVTPEMADVHMRVWATQFRGRKVKA